MWAFSMNFWSEYKDSNLGPPGPKPGALPDCATLRQDSNYSANRYLFGFRISFLLPQRRSAKFVCFHVSARPLCYRGLHAVAGDRCSNALALKLLAKKVQQNIGLRFAEAFPVSMTVAG